MEKLILKCGKEEHHLFYLNILFLEADGPYTTFHTTEGNFTICKNIGIYEEILPFPPFLRVHNSYIINADKISLKAKNFVLLEHKIRIPVSRRMKGNLKISASTF